MVHTVLSILPTHAIMSASMKETTTRNLEETFVCASEFALSLTLQEDRGTVVALYGELGSGKTSFVQGVAKALGVDVTIISPTFVIERIYKLSHKNFDRMVHIDCYRIEDASEMTLLGWDEKTKNPRNLIFVEWAERIEEILPPHTTRVYFEFVEETIRRIKVLNPNI